jgi:hypothetical protein
LNYQKREAEKTKNQMIDELENAMRELKVTREVERNEAEQCRRRLERKLKALRERIAADVGEGDSNSVDETSRSGTVDLSSEMGGTSPMSNHSGKKFSCHHTKRTRQELQRQITALQHVQYFSPPHILSSFVTIIVTL